MDPKLAPTAPCRGCGAVVAWRLTIKGKKMPLDPEPVENGNIVINRGGFAVVLDRERIAKLAARADRAAWPLYISHFATCPRSADFRGNR